MDGAAKFAVLEPYQLSGVKVITNELGRDLYASVQELEYIGLKCVGKKIHDQLLSPQGVTSSTVHRFEEECDLLSKLRHPNIVQFMGVFFQQGVRVPTLVMEFLPTNLTSCIEQYGILPKEINYSILHDVALGLCYLHSQTPPIVHRDLSSNNVLLTASMTAKISGLGMARILDLSPLQISRMAQTPGTLAHMPPEVMTSENPEYNTSIDKFSYGILMIHIFSGKLPHPQAEPNRIESSGKIVPISEAERRKAFLKVIVDNPLKNLILRLINNDPQVRPRTREIVEQLAVIQNPLEYPAAFANRLEMLRYIERQNEEHKRQILELRQEAQEKAEEAAEEKSKLESYEAHIEGSVKTKAQELKAQQTRKWKQTDKDIDVQPKADAESSSKEVAFPTNESAESKASRHKDSIISRTLLALCKYVMVIVVFSTISLLAYNSYTTHSPHDVPVLQANVSQKEYRYSPVKVLQANITWKECAEVPVWGYQGMTTVINGKVYYGGGLTTGNDNDSIVFCYYPSQDKWTTLPPLPVRWFGLGQLDGKLVVVGGRNKVDDRLSDKVYTYDEQSKRWEPEVIPPMPTAKDFPIVSSLHSALVVASRGTYTNTACTVEIFKPGTSQWLTEDSLIKACQEEVSLVAIDNTCYALGGYEYPTHFSQALYSSVYGLLRDAVPALTNQTNSNSTKSAWKTLPGTPTYQPTASMLGGQLLAVGGKETSQGGGADTAKVYMYSPVANDWLHVSDLPTPRSNAAIALLSSTEILVIGGWGDGIRVRSVYRGTLKFSMTELYTTTKY